ncbi:MAG TPA: cytochrome P450 [Actinomycetota bacterium]|nr:cytochrome P450 [Actinomycetota bacterium]
MTVRSDEIDLSSHDAFVEEVPLRAFKELREQDPVHWQPEPTPNRGFWAVTRFHDIEDILRDTKRFSSAHGITLEEQTEEEVEARRSMIDMDPPNHSQLRRLVSKLFTRSAVAQYEGFIREQARLVLDGGLPKGEFDFVEEISRELPIRVLARIMGVPDEDLPMCVELGDAMIAQADPEYSRAVIDKEDTSEYRLLPFRSPAAVELMAYGHRLAEERRAEPRDDLVTKLVQSEVDGEGLTTAQFDNFFCLLIVAGNETTRHAITHGVRALVDHPDQWRRLRDEPELMPLAAEEILRYGSPTMHFRRTAQTDLELHGTRIRQGDKVVVWFVSGNYDEEVFTDAERFDVGRDPNPHMAFGSGGPHVCLGAHLARLEVRVMFEELIPRLESLEITGPVERLRSNFINGIKHMPVRVSLA